MRSTKQIGLVLALIAFGLGAAGFAVPVKPDLDKILDRQEHLKRNFEPAQAGWNGPEMQRPQDVAPNPVLAAYGPAATARSIRASLVAAAIPDPKAVAAITVLIVLMRLMRQSHQRHRQKPRVVAIRAVPGEERRAA